MFVGRAAQRFNWKLRHLAALRQIAGSVGIDLYTHTDDRRVLHDVIFPQFSDQPQFKKILFVGCDWYTRDYARFFADQEFVTLDIDPAKRRYGARRHVTDCVTNVDRHFGRAELDLVVCNGVLGWGLNAANDLEATFWAIRRVLRPGGLLILGWNDAGVIGALLDACESLRQFTRYAFPPLGDSRFLTSTPYRHTYDFYVR